MLLHNKPCSKYLYGSSMVLDVMKCESSLKRRSKPETFLFEKYKKIKNTYIYRVTNSTVQVVFDFIFKEK